MNKSLILAAALTSVSACSSNADVDKLEARITVLEQKVKQLDPERSGGPTLADRVATLENGGGKGIRKLGNKGDDAEARKLYSQADAAASKGSVEEAREALATLLKEHSGSRMASQARRMQAELKSIGKEVSNPEIVRWFNGSADDMNLLEGTTLLVFWEVWCPHCRKETPRIQQQWAKDWKNKIKLVGVTQVNRNATDDQVTEFLKENGITYPVAKETGALSRTFAVSGVPAAAAVKDGKIIWRGHPARVNNELIDSWK